MPINPYTKLSSVRYSIIGKMPQNSCSDHPFDSFSCSCILYKVVVRVTKTPPIETSYYIQYTWAQHWNPPRSHSAVCTRFKLWRRLSSQQQQPRRRRQRTAELSGEEEHSLCSTFVVHHWCNSRFMVTKRPLLWFYGGWDDKKGIFLVWQTSRFANWPVKSRYGHFATPETR